MLKRLATPIAIERREEAASQVIRLVGHRGRRLRFPRGAVRGTVAKQRALQDLRVVLLGGRRRVLTWEPAHARGQVLLHNTTQALHQPVIPPTIVECEGNRVELGEQRRLSDVENNVERDNNEWNAAPSLPRLTGKRRAVRGRTTA